MQLKMFSLITDSTVPNERNPRKFTHRLLQIRHCVENVKSCAVFTNTALARTLSLRRLLRIFALAATMLLAVLLHLLIFHLLTASDVPAPPRKNAEHPAAPHKDAKQLALPHKDTDYKVSHVDSCPDVGFYFKREATPNSLFPDACYLCFCQGDHTAVCWKRDNRKCNQESFHYHGIGKRDKRSPGFTDIFFRDASRDIFNKNTKTQCKPYESSFSDDCPPADWCVGCTVCDCDANGRWDCHLLSFCPDGKKKKSNNKKPPPVPDEWLQYVEKTKEKLSNDKKSPKKSKPIKAKVKTYKTKVSNNKGKPVQRRGNQKPAAPKRIVKKNVPLRAGMTQQPGKMKTPIKYRKFAHNKANKSKKTIKKNIATRKPIQIKKKPNKNTIEAKLAHNLMKQVMQNLRRQVSAKMKNMSEITRQNAANVKNQKAKTKVNQTKNKPKTVQKRQIKKTNPKPPMKKMREPMKKSIYRAREKTTKKPDYGKYVRNKREVKISGNTGIFTDAIQDNYTESTNTTVALNVIPVTSNPLVPDVGNFKYALGGSSIHSGESPDNTYYKYTVSSGESRTPISIIDVPIGETTTTQFNKTETVFDLISPPLTPNVPTEKRQVKNVEANKSINFTVINPEENDLKYSKFHKIKILKEKTLISDYDIKHKSLTKLMPPTDKVILIENKNRSHGKSIERKLSYKKYNVVKLLNHSKCKFEDCRINNSINVHSTPINIKSDLHGYLTKIFNNHHNNGKTYLPKRKRQLSVLKYLKGIFNKIFKGKKTPVRMNRHQLIETLCENFGPCLKMNRKDKVLLNLKLAELNRETAKILKTVRIIKGLLKLLDLTISNNSDISKQEHIRNDIQKLSQILKGDFVNGNTLKTTQKTQIEYIKRSTKDFMQLVSKFGSLLNEIITILTKDGTNRLRNKANKYFMNKDLSIDDPFQSFKNLLLRYNLVQNKFMKQMYEQLNNFENKINEKPKVSEVKDFNNNVAIENISRNIIHNLRKLKRLAQTVSYRGRGPGRTKRDIAREDDAIEYLLMMMEYLIKQNHPLDEEPVNDGIDLLIDAIKNAPDIKPIKKKVLEYTPAIVSDTTTTTSTTPLAPPIRTAVPDDTQSEDDSPSEREKNSSIEDSSKIKQEDNARKFIENKDFVNIVDDEKDFEDKFQYDRKAEPEKSDVITEMSFFNKLEREDRIIEESESILETTTLINTVVSLDTDTNDKLVTRNYLNVDKTHTDNNHLDRPVDYTEVSGKKIEVYSGDMDEENIVPSTVSTESSDLPTTLTTELKTHRVEAQKSKIKMKNLEKSDNDRSDKRSELKWIEENFGKKTEKGYVDLEEDENNSSRGLRPTTAKAITAKILSKIDSTGVTREKGELRERNSEVRERNGEVRERNGEIEKYDVTEKKKTTAKLSAEEIMFRKQMELLNSLDYGTERAEIFEADGRDSNVDERYSGDSFPSYFV